MEICILLKKEDCAIDTVFSLEHGPGVHTTCNYQCPLLSLAANKNVVVKPLVVFVFLTLEISKRIRNFETHIWMVHVVQHATAIPVFIEGNSVTFGWHKDISVEAWDGGKKYSKQQR